MDPEGLADGDVGPGAGRWVAAVEAGGSSFLSVSICSVQWEEWAEREDGEEVQELGGERSNHLRERGPDQGPGEGLLGSIAGPPGAPVMILKLETPRPAGGSPWSLGSCPWAEVGLLRRAVTLKGPLTGPLVWHLLLVLNPQPRHAGAHTAHVLTVRFFPGALRGDALRAGGRPPSPSQQLRRPGHPGR